MDFFLFFRPFLVTIFDFHQNSINVWEDVFEKMYSSSEDKNENKLQTFFIIEFSERRTLNEF